MRRGTKCREFKMTSVLTRPPTVAEVKDYYIDEIRGRIFSKIGTPFEREFFINERRYNNAEEWFKDLPQDLKEEAVWKMDEWA